ncbi:MAG: SAM-dependent methyltransferase [Clostridia bacterium]|nr:SAM-dependent methyltransferase [Clostridia bacterium]
MDRITTLFDQVFSADGGLIKMVLSDKRKKSQEVSKAVIRPVKIQDKIKYQVEYSVGNKVTHENLDEKAIVEKALSLYLNSFKQMNIFTTDGDIQVLASKADKPRIQKKGATKTPLNLSHNKVKNRAIPEGEPCDFLMKLGVMDQDFKIVPRYYGKYRQINRYLEIIEDVFPYLPTDRTIKIIDFGCGKAYLTFAVYYYLKVLKGKDVEIVGLDLKEDVIDFCNGVAEDLGYQGLTFLKGDIVDYTEDNADMVITLHACDTATDYALINAVSWNTKVILSVPCCQHELFKQIKEPTHECILKYGILKDRLTEYLTDGLRALKLESKGYQTSMIEFTSLEHTQRNILIKAIKSRSITDPKSVKALMDYENLRDFYHIKPTIDKL